MKSRDDELYHFSPAIYAYVAPVTLEILYIGKAYGSSTVRKRRDAPDKDALYEIFARLHGVGAHHVFVARLQYDSRITRQLVADIESLLINRLQPHGNRQAKRTRIWRPGLEVECLGQWPHEDRHFIDDDRQGPNI